MTDSIITAAGFVCIALAIWDLGRRWLSQDQLREGWNRVQIADLRRSAGRSLEELGHRIDELDDRTEALAARVAERNDEPVDIEEMRSQIDEYNGVCGHLEARADKYEKALENFWKLVGEQFVRKDELKKASEELKAGQAAIVATGSPRFRARAG